MYFLRAHHAAITLFLLPECIKLQDLAPFFQNFSRGACPLTPLEEIGLRPSTFWSAWKQKEPTHLDSCVRPWEVHWGGGGGGTICATRVGIGLMVREHAAYITTCHFRNCRLDFGKVEVVDYERHTIKRRVKEELYINAQENAMKEDRELELTPFWFSVFSLLSCT